MKKAIIWIDDNPLRRRTANDLGATFYDVKNQNLVEIVDTLLDKPAPGLVIIDHILDKTATTNRLLQRGSTIAEAFKERWPHAPVVGITNIGQISQVDQRTRHTYDLFVPFDRFSNYLEQIESLRSGFGEIEKKPPSDSNEIFGLLKAPKDEFHRLSAVLPEYLYDAELDASVSSRLNKWVGHLTERPGFLYDELWSATFLGLNLAGFRRVLESFGKAKYKGIFAVGDTPRWWSSRLKQILFNLEPPKAGEYSWNVGRRLPGILDRRHFSKCYVCDDDFPETVANVDSQSEERYAMHLKHTILHPDFRRELYFEDIRILKN